MTCPYCEAPVARSAQECGSCRLTFPKTSALFGALPRIQREVFDSTRQLTAGQHKDIQKHIQRIQSKYPQLYVQAMLHSFPPPHPLRTQVFWMFNAAGFSGDTRRGPDNHTFLIAIDPGRREVALMPGYGLEACLDEAYLASLLDSTARSWEQGDWTGGILALLDLLDPYLETITIPHDRNLSIPDEF
jgi:uncharacterized membrane protein YgcG